MAHRLTEDHNGSQRFADPERSVCRLSQVVALWQGANLEIPAEAENWSAQIPVP